jgi:hypothetical protein
VGSLFCFLVRNFFFWVKSCWISKYTLCILVFWSTLIILEYQWTPNRFCIHFPAFMSSIQGMLLLDTLLKCIEEIKKGKQVEGWTNHIYFMVQY